MDGKVALKSKFRVPRYVVTASRAANLQRQGPGSEFLLGIPRRPCPPTPLGPPPGAGLRARPGRTAQGQGAGQGEGPGAPRSEESMATPRRLTEVPRHLLVCEKSNFGHEKSRHRHLVETHYHNYRVSPVALSPRAGEA